MPAFPRFNKKANKIAFALIGKPNNIQKQPTFQKKINKQLAFQATARNKGSL